MKIKGIFLKIILTGILFNPQSVYSSDITSRETDSISYGRELSYKLLKNPKSDRAPFYINRLMKLSPALGREKVSGTFKNAAAVHNPETGKTGIHSQILNLAIDELNGTYSQSKNEFTVLKKWNVSGPWRRYGGPDIDYKFNPETVYKIEDIEKGKNLSADINGKVYPCKSGNEADETFYAVCSFSSTEKIILWLITDAEFKLIVNGKEISRSRKNSGYSIQAYSLSGASGYTVQIKVRNTKNNRNPFIRCMVTDEKHDPLKLNYSRIIHNFNFTFENTLSPEIDESVFHESIYNVRKLTESGDYYDGYKLADSIITEHPSFFEAYEALIPLLDIMNRDSEFHKTIAQFRKHFPDSYMHYRWLADFYMTRDKDKFAGIVKNNPPENLSDKAVETYVYMLFGERKYQEAASLCSSHESLSFLRHLIPEIIRASGDSAGWKKSLIDRAAVEDKGSVYYALGLAEMHSGYDPVMYWEKGFSLGGNPGLMADLSDIYENSIIAGSSFYSGDYTDLHPEFGWNGKKRRVSIHIFESGRVLLEGEDTLPSGRKLRGEKYSQGGSEFSSGVIRTWIPYVNSLKILYVLTAKDGLPSPVKFESEPIVNKRLALKYECSGEEEFSIIKYSAEFVNDNSDPFSLVSDLLLKSSDENISWLDYEVICHGNFNPLVRYNGRALSPDKFSEGIVRYSVIERFSKDDEHMAVSSISKFLSDEVFSEWYRDVIRYVESSSAGISLNMSDKDDRNSIIKKIHLYIMTTVAKRSDINFTPESPGSLIRRGSGTVEERTYLAKAILESRGIKSYIAFGKNTAGLINRILLYVPGNRDKNYWLSFYGEGILDKIESRYEAVVITGEGYNTIPVNPETYIR